MSKLNDMQPILGKVNDKTYSLQDQVLQIDQNRENFRLVGYYYWEIRVWDLSYPRVCWGVSRMDWLLTSSLRTITNFNPALPSERTDIWLDDQLPYTRKIQQLVPSNMVFIAISRWWTSDDHQWMLSIWSLSIPLSRSREKNIQKNICIRLP